MTTEQCMNRNNVVLRNLVYNGDIENQEELMIACALLDVKLSWTVYNNFVSMEEWSPKLYGAYKTSMKLISKLYAKTQELRMVMEDQHIEIM